MERQPNLLVHVDYKVPEEKEDREKRSAAQGGGWFQTERIAWVYDEETNKKVALMKTFRFEQENSRRMWRLEEIASLNPEVIFLS